jgi:hypothetical protein
MPTEVFTVRMGFFDTKLWSAESIVALYKAPLKAAGFFTSQLPSIVYPSTPTTTTKDDPFPGAKSISIRLDPFGELTQTRDTRVPLAQDPAKLADAGKAFASIFTWNLCVPVVPQISPSSPSSAPGADPGGALREIFRQTKPGDGVLKLSPKIGTWGATPETLPGYPAKPGRPECGQSPAPAPAGGGKGPGLAPWQKLVLGVVGLVVAKKANVF